MEGENDSRHMSETIQSGDEEFIIEINSDYSDEDNDTELDSPVLGPASDQYDEIDSLEQRSEQTSCSSEHFTPPHLFKGTKIHSPLKIGRDEEGKVNYIGLAQESSSSQLEVDLPPGLENIKIVNVCTLADEPQEDLEGLDADPLVHRSTEEDEAPQGMIPSTFPNMIPYIEPNMIIVDEQPSNSSLMVKLVCKFCEKLFPTHEALYKHARKHVKREENEHSINKHFHKSTIKSVTYSNSIRTTTHKVNKVKKLSTAKKMKGEKRKTGGNVDEENKCEKCGKIYMKDYQYRMHISMCKGKTTQMATCFECNKMIPAHEEYEHALKYHDVVCRICGVNQMQESKLKNHMKFMHNISNYGKDTENIFPQIQVIEQDYYKTCAQCGQVCASFDEYRLHRKGHARKDLKLMPENIEEKVEKTKGKSPVNKKKKDSECESVKCEKCDKTFPSSYHLSSHRKRCSGQAVKMILCDVCEQLFPKDEIKSHVKTHECLCSACGKVCMGERHLMRHRPYCKAKQKTASSKEKQKDDFKGKSQGVKIHSKKKIRAIIRLKNLKRKLTNEQEQLLKESRETRKEVEDRVTEPSFSQASSSQNGCSWRTKDLVKDFVDKKSVMKMECDDIEQNSCDLQPDESIGYVRKPKRDKPCSRKKGGKKRKKKGRQMDILSVSQVMDSICNEKDTNQILKTEIRHTEESEGESRGEGVTAFDPFTGSETFAKKTLLEKADAVTDLQLNIETLHRETFPEYSEETEVSNEKFILKKREKLDSKRVAMSHVSDWLLQKSDSNNKNLQTLICRHCGKQLSSMDEGLNHMIKSHPTNKTTKEIRREINNLKRNKPTPFLNDCFIDSSNASY